MKTFHNQQNPDPHGAQFQEPHSTHARNISPMEILNLANMITQANEVSGCTKPANPPHGKILCNTREIQTGSKCLLQCQFGFIPAQEELTKCNKVKIINENKKVITCYVRRQGSILEFDLKSPCVLILNYILCCH